MRSPKPSQPSRRRRRRINWGRLAAIGLCALLAGSLAWLGSGPWLRVRGVTVEGRGWTPSAKVAAIVDPILGQNLLLLDTTPLADELSALPAVERADIEVGLLGEVHVILVEGGAVAVWRTSAAQLLLAADGTVIGVQSRDAVPGGALAELPRVTDERDASHDLSVGDAVAASELAAGLLLADLPPQRLGSSAATLEVTLDDTYGFVLSSPQVGWRAAFGYYGLDPLDTPETVAAVVESQAGAMRTLFASHPEAQLAWVDVRNPGRVYFRARG